MLKNKYEDSMLTDVIVSKRALIRKYVARDQDVAQYYLQDFGHGSEEVMDGQGWDLVEFRRQRFVG